VKKEKVLQREKEDRNIPQKIKRRKANWIGHILLQITLLKHAFEGKIERIEVAGRRGRRLRSYCMTLTKRQDTGN